jgi:hypothetical protein
MLKREEIVISSHPHFAIALHLLRKQSTIQGTNPQSWSTLLHHAIMLPGTSMHVIFVLCALHGHESCKHSHVIPPLTQFYKQMHTICSPAHLCSNLISRMKRQDVNRQDVNRDSPFFTCPNYIRVRFTVPSQPSIIIVQPIIRTRSMYYQSTTCIHYPLSTIHYPLSTLRKAQSKIHRADYRPSPIIPRPAATLSGNMARNPKTSGFSNHSHSPPSLFTLFAIPHRGIDY